MSRRVHSSRPARGKMIVRRSGVASFGLFGKHLFVRAAAARMGGSLITKIETPVAKRRISAPKRFRTRAPFAAQPVSTQEKRKECTGEPIPTA